MRYVKPVLQTLDARQVIEALGPAAALVSGPYGSGVGPDAGRKHVSQQ